MCGSSLRLVALVALVAVKKAVFVALKKAGLEDLFQILFKSWRLHTKEG